MTRVWQLKLTHQQQSVLLVMADHANDDGRNAFPSNRLIAWKTGYSKRTVQRTIRSLEALGILIKENAGKGGFRGFNKYGRYVGVSTVYRVELRHAPKKAPFIRNQVDWCARFYGG